MNILLTAINTKYIHSNLAVYSLKAYHDKKSKNNNVSIAEFTINQYTDDIIRNIYIRKPDVIAFSCYLWNIEYIYEIVAELKKLLPDTDIWLGGPEVTYDSISILEKYPEIKGVMIGEGEDTFFDICKIYEDDDCENGTEILKKQFINIPGIVVRHKGNIVTTPSRPLLNMDELPFVYKDMSAFANKIIYYESSRGCPFGCSYCLSSVEKSVRFRSLSLVFDELKYFLDIKVAQVKFVDRTFNCNHDRTLKLLEFILNNDNGITNFHFEIAADLLREDELKIISKMRAGLVQLEIGVQSANALTIEAIDRVMNLDVLSEVVGNVNKYHNVHQHLDLIAGLPYEDLDTFKKSFNYVYNLRPEQLQLGFLKVLKGSKMFSKAKEYGIVYKNKPPYEVMFTNWLSYDDVLHLKQIEEMVELYYNSRQYVYTMEYWCSFFESPFKMYECLAAYYEQNQLYDVKHSRITRYNILVQCIEKWIKENNKSDELLKRFQQILTFDLFKRENLKTRPSFALDLQNLKPIIRELYVILNAPKSAHIEPFYIDSNTFEEMSKIGINKVNIKKISFDMENIRGCQLEEWQTYDNLIYVLFDYENREPLNNSAAITVIQF